MWLKTGSTSITKSDAQEEDDRVWAGLREALPGGFRRTVLLWRVYSGNQSWVRDAVSTAAGGVHRLTLRGLEGAGLLVGRVLRVVSRRATKVRADPFMRRRLTQTELE